MKKFIYILIFSILIFILINTVFNKSSNVNSNKDYVHELFNTQNFDKSNFNGILYDENLNEYNILELLDTEVLSLKNKYSKYFFTKNIEEESTKLNSNNSSSPTSLDVNYLIEILGNPSSVYEKYFEKEYNEGKKFSGQASLLYNYDNYIIEVLLWDFRNWPDKDEYISYYGINVYTVEYFKKNLKNNYDDFNWYGENIFN